MVIRKATVQDIDTLIQLRMDYLVGERDTLSDEEVTAMKQQLKPYFSKHISDNTFIGMLAETEGQVVSVAYLVISEKPASPSFITGMTGTLLNVLTYPEYRHKGIATKVINKVIEEARLLDVSSIDLSATSDGKPLYVKLGFHISNYTSMRLLLK